MRTYVRGVATLLVLSMAATAVVLAAPTASATPDPPTYSAAVLADSPVAYYRLDESLNPFVDSSGHGDPSGALQSGAGVGPVLAQNDGVTQGLNFAVSNGTYVAVPSSGAFNLSGSFSLEAWVKPSSTDAEASIVERYGDQDAAHGYGLRMTAGGVVRGFLSGGRGDVYSTSPLVANHIYHLV